MSTSQTLPKALPTPIVGHPQGQVDPGDQSIVFGSLGLLFAIVGILIAVLQLLHMSRRARTIEIFELACKIEDAAYRGATY